MTSGAEPSAGALLNITSVDGDDAASDAEIMSPKMWPSNGSNVEPTGDIFSNELDFNPLACNLTALTSVNTWPIRYIVMTSYLLAFVFGLGGNTLVIYIIGHFSKVRGKSVANYYIWNLAFADELYVLALPLFCWATYSHQWPLEGVLGDISCKVAYVARDITKFTSIFTLVALSLDRCVASYHNLSYLRTVQVGKLVCAAIWILCGLISIHYVLYAKTVYTSDHRVICKLKWPYSPDGDSGYRIFWTVFQLSVGLVLPSAVIFGAYALLFQRLKQIVGHRKTSRLKKPSYRMTRTVLVVAATFTLCHLPYHAMQIVTLVQQLQQADAIRQGTCYQMKQDVILVVMYLSALAQILVFIASCSNPILYGVLNENYSKYHKYSIHRNATFSPAKHHTERRECHT